MTERPKKKTVKKADTKRKPPVKKVPAAKEKAAARAKKVPTKPKPGNFKETLDEMAEVIVTYVHRLSVAVEEIQLNGDRIPSQIDSLAKALKSLDELHARLHAGDQKSATVNLYFDGVKFDPKNPSALPDPVPEPEAQPPVPTEEPKS